MDGLLKLLLVEFLRGLVQGQVHAVEVLYLEAHSAELNDVKLLNFVVL